MLTLRLIDANDYTVHEDGQPIGRIRLARERSPSIWLWHVAVNIPGPPYGDARTLDEAKQRFKAAWIGFKDKHGPEKLAKIFDEMNFANRPGRYRRRRTADGVRQLLKHSGLLELSAGLSLTLTGNQEAVSSGSEFGRVRSCRTVLLSHAGLSVLAPCVLT